MKRDLLLSLKLWKNRAGRKPLLIRGARQVGKTWLMKEFGKTEYPQVAYFNFESNPLLKNIFESDFDITRILLALEIESGLKINQDTLIILDEIQEAKGGLTSLKYFHENAPEYHLIAAGSLLGVALNHGSSFPVGKVEFMDLYPLNFSEFLVAIGESKLVELLNTTDWDLITAFKSRLIERLKQYYVTGGMPEVVYNYSINPDFKEVKRLQKNILLAYEQDFAKHAPKEIVPRIRMVWNSIPAQLARENKKFIFGLIKEGARAREFEMAIEWLLDCGLLHKVNQVSKPSIPLSAYENLNAFKLYHLDLGLLSALSDLDERTILDGNKIFTEFKGAITEQYVLQQLVAGGVEKVFYWSGENLRSEVDFILQLGGKVVPVEVKAEENLQSKSLKVFVEKFQPQMAIRSSMSDYREESWMINWPLYAIHLLLKN
jgi:predicted AAA+ superfamily ATPase